MTGVRHIRNNIARLNNPLLTTTHHPRQHLPQEPMEGPSVHRHVAAPILFVGPCSGSSSGCRRSAAAAPQPARRRRHQRPSGPHQPPQRTAQPQPSSVRGGQRAVQGIGIPLRCCLRPPPEALLDAATQLWPQRGDRLFLCEEAGRGGLTHGSSSAAMPTESAAGHPAAQEEHTTTAGCGRGHVSTNRRPKSMRFDSISIALLECGTSSVCTINNACRPVSAHH